MKKTYILDTNVLLHDPTAITSFKDNTVILPFPVIEELDKHKSRQDEIGLNARQTSRTIFENIKGDSFIKGAKLLNGGTLKVVSLQNVSEFVSEETFASLDKEKNDNEILKIAFGLSRQALAKNSKAKNIPTLITDDTILYIKAQALDVPCEKYQKNSVVDNASNLYSGVTSVVLDKESVIQDCYTIKGKTTTQAVTRAILKQNKNLHPNEFVFIKHTTPEMEKVQSDSYYDEEMGNEPSDEEDFNRPPEKTFEEENAKVLKKLSPENKELITFDDDFGDEELVPYMGKYVPPKPQEKNFDFNRIKNQSLALRYIKSKNTFKHVRGLKTKKLNPRNREQELALDLLLDPSIKLVTLSGIAGTGKTLISIAAGLQMVLEDKLYKNMIICRPLVSAGGKRNDIGFLPGSKMEKLAEWASPVKDNLKFLLGKGLGEQQSNIGNNTASAAGRKREHTPEQTMNYLFEKNIIEFEALSFIRGRSFMDAYILIEEGQNLTKEDLKTILTRVGENTKIVIAGDIDQIDQPFIDSVSNGLTVAIEKFKDYDISGHITLVKGERSELATLSAKIL